MKGPYDFTAKEAQYRGYEDQRELLYALKDARSCVRICRQARRECPALATNEGYYMDDVCTIRKVLAEKGVTADEIDRWLEAREV